MQSLNAFVLHSIFCQTPGSASDQTAEPHLPWCRSQLETQSTASRCESLSLDLYFTFHSRESFFFFSQISSICCTVTAGLWWCPEQLLDLRSPPLTLFVLPVCWRWLLVWIWEQKWTGHSCHCYLVFSLSIKFTKTQLPKSTFCLQSLLSLLLLSLDI